MSTRTEPVADGRNKLGWMLNSLDVEGVGFAVLLSGDGLRLAHSDTVSLDDADRFAAAASGVQSLGKALAEFCGGSGNRLRQNLAEYDEGLILITAAGENALLAVSASDSADVGLIAHRMTELAVRLGHEMTSSARRQPAGDPDSRP